MIQLMILLTILFVAGFVIWSMLVSSPILTVSVLVVWLGVIYFLDRELRRG